MADIAVTVTNLRFRLGETGRDRTREMAMEIRFSNARDNWTVTIPAISTDAMRLLLRQIDIDRIEDSTARDTFTEKNLNVRLSP
jgi:hypothetical protein